MGCHLNAAVVAKCQHVLAELSVLFSVTLAAAEVLLFFLDQ